MSAVWPWPALRRAPAEYDDAFMETMAHEYTASTPWTRLRLAALKELVEPVPSDRILDLGCAAGALTDFFSKFGCDVVGIDSEPRAVMHAQRVFPDHTFMVADARRLPFEDHSFDKAVAGDLVEHLDNDVFAEMLRELRRVLVPSGTLTIYTPNPKHLIERAKAHDFILAQNPTHIGLRSAGTIREALTEAGFRIERDEWRPSFFRGFRVVEVLGGPVFESLRYRLCIRAATA
jgi:SAM-dependent methyltransferase